MNAKFKRAIALIDEANCQDPTIEIWHGQKYPKELLYSQRMSAWLYRLESEDASFRSKRRQLHKQGINF